MAGGYCIEWSAWRVWLHPHRALDAINDAEVMESDYERRLKEAIALIEEQKKECARLTNEVSELSRRCVESENSLADTRRQLKAALDELADQKSVDSKIEEFNKMLEGVEDMKRNYEKRIRTLEARLRDEKKRSGREDSSDIIDTIDMKGNAPSAYRTSSPRSSSSGTASSQSRTSSNDETFAPRVVDTPEPKPPRIIISDDKPAINSDGKRRDSDDWLLELPPDL